MQASSSNPIPITSLRDKNLQRLLVIFGLFAIHLLLSVVALLGATTLSIIAFAALWIVLILGMTMLRPIRVLFIFIFLLPIYQWFIVIVYQITGSNTIVSAVQPWKELLVFGTLILILGYYVFFVNRIKLKFKAMDLLILAYLGLNILYLIIPFGTSFFTRLYGFRSLTVLVFLYCLGRIVPISQHYQKHIIKAFLYLGIGAGIFALIDRFVLPIDWPTRIGFYQYLARDTTSHNIGFIGPMYMPWTFWTSTAMRRTSSFFANPLDSAAAMHILGTTALIMMIGMPKRTKLHQLAKFAFACTLIALLFSISRTSIVAFIVECLIVCFLLRKKGLLVIFMMTAFIAFILALFSPLGHFIIETLTLQNSSLIGHLAGWEEGYLAIFQTPWGLGPGTSGHAGARTGNQVGGESQYIITGVQLGVAGLLLYIAMQIFAIRSALRLFQRASGETQILALIAGVSRIGLAAIAFTANSEIYLFTAYVSWWLIGWVNQTHPTGTQNHVIEAKTSEAPLTGSAIQHAG